MVPGWVDDVLGIKFVLRISNLCRIAVLAVLLYRIASKMAGRKVLLNFNVRRAHSPDKESYPSKGEFQQFHLVFLYFFQQGRLDLIPLQEAALEDEFMELVDVVNAHKGHFPLGTVGAFTAPGIGDEQSLGQ